MPISPSKPRISIDSNIPLGYLLFVLLYLTQISPFQRYTALKLAHIKRAPLQSILSV